MGDSFIFIITYYWVYHISQADRFCAQTTKVLNWHSPTAIGICLLRIAENYHWAMPMCPKAIAWHNLLERLRLRCETVPGINSELRNSLLGGLRGCPQQNLSITSPLGTISHAHFGPSQFLFAKWQESFGKKNPDTCWLKKLENIKQASFLDVAHIPLALIRWIVIAPVKRGLLDNPPFTLMIFLLRLKPHLVGRVSRHVSLPGVYPIHSFLSHYFFSNHTTS